MSLSDEKLVGRWEGEGTEVLFEVDADKVYKVKYEVKMTIKKVNTDIYRIKSKYYYVKDGKVFGTSYKADKLSASEDYLFNKHEDMLVGSGLWNEKDVSSKTIEHVHFNSDFSTMYYKYNTNEINNPLNAYFKKLSISAGRLLGMETGKISVAGNFKLEKVDE
jgi:hypothetical protein